ncbi:hypothetical protein B0H13DRAFT_2371598 [Mycena leptocephala]|nr:hypothetical protein B0H13DRAFT_2371598 [Mycena leptocephala]
MSDLTLVGPSQDPAGLSSINLEELSATSTAEIEQTDVALHASQPACLSSIRLKEQITTTTALEQKDQLAATAPMLEDAFPEPEMRVYPAAVVVCGLSPHPITNAVLYGQVFPAAAISFVILAWRAISVSFVKTSTARHLNIALSVDTEITNHRFLYPSWDKPAQVFDADFNRGTPPHKLIHYHGPPLLHLCPTCEEPVSALPHGLPSAIDWHDPAKEMEGEDISFARFCLDRIDERVFQWDLALDALPTRRCPPSLSSVHPLADQALLDGLSGRDLIRIHVPCALYTDIVIPASVAVFLNNDWIKMSELRAHATQLLLSTSSSRKPRIHASRERDAVEILADSEDDPQPDLDVEVPQASFHNPSGIGVSLLEAIRSARQIDENIAREIEATMTSGILPYPPNERPSSVSE